MKSRRGEATDRRKLRFEKFSCLTFIREKLSFEALHNPTDLRMYTMGLTTLELR